MQFNLIELSKIIKSSDLNQVEQEEFLSLFSKSNDDELAIVLNVFKDDPNWINRLYKNYKEKKGAFKQKDKNAWREMLQDEYNALRKVESLDY